MRVAELMITDLKTVGPDAPVAEAVTTMADAHVSALPVVDRKGRLIGVISATDVLRATAESGNGKEREQVFDDTPIRELMTPRPATVSPDADVREAALPMLYLEVHRLFVEDDDRLVGVISQSDIVRAVATAKI